MTCRKVLVIAMDNEAAAVTAHFADVSESAVFGRRVIRGTFGGEPCAVVVAGIGKSNAAAATQLALSLFEPEEVLNAGVAGALHAPMQVAEVYQVRAAVQYDFDLAQLNGTAVGVLNEYDTPYLEVARFDIPAASGIRGWRTLATGDHFNDSEADYDLIVSTLGATLRDMEGGAIAHVCKRSGVPCHLVKCVSDVAGRGSMTGQFEQALRTCLKRLRCALEFLKD